MTDRRMRAYTAPHHANAGKVQAIAELLPWWQRGLVHVQLVQVRRLKNGEKLGWVDTRNLPGYLSQRQWKSVVNQVNTALRSWQELMTIAVRPFINKSGLSDEERHRLHKLNLRHAWWDEPQLRGWVEHLAGHGHPFPNLSRCRTMLMDGPVAQLEPSRTETFAQWARISVRPGHKPVRVPLGRNPYADNQPGHQRNFCQVHIDPHTQTLTIRTVKSSDLAVAREHGNHLGLDWGLVNLITTSDGRRYGQQLYRWIKDHDTQLTELERALNRAHIRYRDSRRWRKLDHRIRAHVTNEVGRILNIIAADTDLASLTVEDLDFRGTTGLSKRMRVLVAKAGRAAFKHKLARLTEDHGIAITRVNAAYTSRQCSGCGYTSKHNRITQSQFRCRFCHKTLHADVNAARNISARRSDGTATLRTSKRQVLANLDRRFHNQWGITFGQASERQTRPHSRANPRPKTRVQLNT